MTPQNKDLEIALIRNNVEEVRSALNDGANIAFNGGNFFIRACCSENVEIVKLFVEHPQFIKQSLAIIKSGYQNLFHQGFLYSGARGNLDIFEYLHKSPVYQQLGNSSYLTCFYLDELVKPECTHILTYALQELKIHKESIFDEKFSNLSSPKKELLTKLLFPIQLNESLSEKETQPRLKI